MRHTGFTDLRMSNASGASNEDSVWPSFTDIMTVIVMIFLMSLVVILIRNVNLVEQLRESMVSEQEIAVLAQAEEQQRIALEAALVLQQNDLQSVKDNLDNTLHNLNTTKSDLDQTQEKLG